MTAKPRKKRPTDVSWEDPPPPLPPEVVPVYAFPTRCRCPRCSATQTVRTSAEGMVQRRRCLRCRHRFKITGKRV